MGKKKLPVKWDKQAKSNLDAICTYIEQDSVQAARKVKKALVELAGSLNDFPEKYAAEPYLKDEPENYRSVSKWFIRSFLIYQSRDHYSRHIPHQPKSQKDKKAVSH